MTSLQRNSAGLRLILEELALGSRILAANGHADYIWGHAAVRDPDGRGAWMKRAGVGFDEVGIDDLVLVSPEGEVLEGEGPRHVEWPIHLDVLAARPDVSAVVHSHPPHSIALGAAGIPLQAVSHAATFFIPPEVPRFTRTAALIVDHALGNEVATALGAARALLLVNHGIVVTGRDVPEAVCGAILLENAAQQQLLVDGFGGASRFSSEDEALLKREQIWNPSGLKGLWDYLVRSLAGTDPLIPSVK